VFATACECAAHHFSALDGAWRGKIYDEILCRIARPISAECRAAITGSSIALCSAASMLSAFAPTLRSAGPSGMDAACAQRPIRHLRDGAHCSCRSGLRGR
jgi:hypothetical protein